jgi:TonB family protein
MIGVLLFTQLGFGFQADEAIDMSAPNKGVVPGRLIRKVQPEYPQDAKAAGIQGTVVLQVIIDQNGVPTQITVLSPLGFGLDEAAATAIAQWRYAPTTMDKKPVSVVTQITVNFSLTNADFNAKVEKQRTDFNVALHAVQKGAPNSVIVKSLQNLASAKYPAGMYLYGKILEDGRGVTADADQGFRLIQESADKKYGPAMYEIAVERLQGGRLDKDPAKGMELMRSAGRLGSRGAQEFLGQAYEKGGDVPVDLDKSRQYFRLCAADGDSACQFRLGKSLLEHSDNQGRDYVQAIAWLQLASDHGNGDAEKMLQQEDARVTPAQLKAAHQLMTQLVHAQ